MTKDEALKLAMEAMEITGGFDVEINAIKESLADPSPNFNCKSVQARLATAWGYVKAQPEQEPVAWIDKMVIDVPNQPLYTAPHTWVGLTDEEIQYCVELKNPEAIAEEIEAKLKEKNT